MNQLIIQARSIARRTGLKRLYYRLFPNSGYEVKLNTALFEQLKANDVVWDVGANCGYYSKLFCEKTGPSGQVFAFEPAPATFLELSSIREEYPWAQIHQVALSDFDGESKMNIQPDVHVVNHLQWQDEPIADAHTVAVKVVRGDTFWSSTGITPNLIKIDVEGFEEEVLEGMGELLRAPELRAIFIEVHFQILEERGRAEAPLRIERLLRGKGLQVKWIGSGHICGYRQQA